MEVKFAKRKKRQTRNRNELNDTSSQEELKFTTIETSNNIDEEDKDVPIFQSRIRVAPSISNTAPVTSAYYQSSYTKEKLNNLKEHQQTLNDTITPVKVPSPRKNTPLEVIKEESCESESDNEKKEEDVPVIEDDIDDSDRERAKEAREFRLSLRKRNEPEPKLTDDFEEDIGPTKEPKFDNSQRISLYKLSYLDKMNYMEESDEDEEEQFEKLEKEFVARGIGRRERENAITKFSSNKLSVRNQLGYLVRDIKSKCEALSIDHVKWFIEKNTNDIQTALDVNTKRYSEINRNFNDCLDKIDKGKNNIELANKRENYYCNLLGYMTDLEDLFGNYSNKF